MDAQQELLPLFEDKVTPARSLPDERTLRHMADTLCKAWECEDLAGRVRVEYNSRLSTTLGRALLNDMRVELNPRLLRENPGELLPTLAHELAHVVVHLRFGRVAPHGREFKTLMRAVNLSAKATHNLPVGHLRKKRTKYLYLHRCEDCGYQFVARTIRRQYYCLACGPEMKWDIFRVPNSKAGLKLLEQLRKQK